MSNIIPVVVYRSVKPEGLRIKLADPYHSISITLVTTVMQRQSMGSVEQW